MSVEGISTTARIAITITEPTNAPITVAVMPSTNALMEVFFAYFLKYGAGITVSK